MNFNYLKILKYCILFLFSIVLLTACGRKQDKNKNHLPSHLQEVIERGKLRAVTDYNSINYFIYRGTPMGYQYELLKELADHLGVELELKVADGLEDSFKMLENGKTDLLAFNLTITKERSERVDFTVPIIQTHQVLVQQKPENWRKLTKEEMNIGIIRNQLNLAGETIYVQENSSHAQRLKNLSEEIGNRINIIEVPMVVEELIKLVAKGNIEYTICDENVAKVNKTYYPNIDVQTAISFPQHIAWAVDKNSNELLNIVNHWLLDFKKTLKYKLIYNKYFKNRKSVIRVKSDYYTIASGKISPYDELFKKYSKIMGWDWRLYASMIYQESRFNPNVKSWAGAFGIAQLMPETAVRYNVTIESPVTSQLWASAKFIKWLDLKLKDKVADEEERVKFILGAYNVGLGHILDARQLAKKYGKNPRIWDENVAFFLLNKSKPAFYKDPVVRYGYCRGEEPYNYVKEILKRFDHYKNIIEEQKEQAE